ncbi:cobalamin biosynthesis protein CbiX [Actinomadura sp. 7K534]|uniref:sirohydrochlorin chelatase n=1 Tax=Actinomadura sp. 7K534 TaxID=2530366 RepID=UPI00104A2AE3|nr:cobalamin biosynthesis protein CbiX [Actinomadura sp. 7K534]TDB99289.1 cobalamin biosynthesis protein CbiX [Actinomadura sp. 7K534]
MTAAPGGRRAVLPVGGHESTGAGGVHGPGRELRTALRDRPRAVAVPMTLGRDPGLAPAAAQTLGWAARDRMPGDLLLAEPLGTVTHLVGWIRAAVMRVLREGEFDGAVLLVAPAADPEADAELFKVARLVWRYLPVRWVEVALTGGEPGVAEGVERCRRLGAGEVALVPASLVPPPPFPGTVPAAGPLLGRAALTALIRERVAEAERRWDRDGQDGLAAAAAHGHGHTHAHTHDHKRVHAHGGGHERHRHAAFPETTQLRLKEATAHGG